uniref:Carboxylic ester hydrolase n=1 Tax=Panagrolaimus davidi TaxID=227884 RepID=A0A914QLH1_9BILA
MNCESTNSSKIIKTEYGSVEGFIYKTSSGKEIEIFLGIPFAAPPIGDLRFEKPQQPSPWNTTLQAKEFPGASATYANFMGHTDNEDCLYLNILKPKEPSPDKNGYPIMFFVYGGSFIVGDSKTYGYKTISENIVERGIIVVIIQYRLGPFGFFSTDDPNFSGNLGLWDQLEALKFVNKVIGNFGGDKSRITLVGQSAGAASVSLLALSEHANDLFSQSITMSGSAFSQWATKNNITEIALKVAEKLGCKNATNIKDCLKTKNVTEFQAAIQPYIQFMDPVDLNPVPIGPKMDGDFITAKTLEEALEKAPKKSTLSMPGSTPPGKYFGILPENVANYSKTNLEEFVKVVFAKEKYFGKNANAFVKEVVDFYLNQTSDKNPNFNFFFQQYTTVMSDVHFNVPALREAKLKSKNETPTYFLLFDYNIDVSDNSSKYIRGSAHGDDVATLFGSLYKKIKTDENGKNVQKKFSEIIANFIKTGVPSIGSIKVPQITKKNFQYIHMNEKPSVKSNLWKERLEFWNNIGKKYGFDLASGNQMKNDNKLEL